MRAAGGSDAVVSARDVSVRYRAAGSSSAYVAVRGVTLEIGRGEIVGLVGESGSGKSTLALAIAGLIGAHTLREHAPEISGGTLSVLGIPLRHARKRRLDRVTLGVGYLPQDGAERLNAQLTVGENVAEPIYLRDRRFPPSEAKAAVAIVIDSLRLPLGILQKLPYELSSGQRQRVALARALILEPTLLVADEPTLGVDATARASVLDVIAGLRDERQLSALVVSSSLADVGRIAPCVAVMQRGIIVGMGTVDELLDGPHHPYVKGLARFQSGLNDQRENSAG